MIMNKKTIIKELSLYKKQNLNKYQIKKIGIFGSASKDCMNEQSDIDIVVELEKPELFYMIGIKQDLEATFNMPIDIVRYRDKMNDALKRRINLEAIYV
ncbi:DNA polymerase, beta domain protein region [Desulfamplus magnetovallimortis]|uniref:DNA polymerase, beta domain protein region n=2 Tax=Desulfamplus magnetovallimortis TaxID=1246637 RepID=A0A1W1HCP0_9BACT|nr:DNA polymerase, beta domain protein region [Desulfamplus magnetovallimortis]